jgi:hypothetical protein
MRGWQITMRTRLEVAHQVELLQRAQAVELQLRVVDRR